MKEFELEGYNPYQYKREGGYILPLDCAYEKDGFLHIFNVGYKFYMVYDGYGNHKVASCEVVCMKNGLPVFYATGGDGEPLTGILTKEMFFGGTYNTFEEAQCRADELNKRNGYNPKRNKDDAIALLEDYGILDENGKVSEEFKDIIKEKTN